MENIEYILQMIKIQRIDIAKELIDEKYKDNTKLNYYYTGLCCCSEDNYKKAIYYFNHAKKNGLKSYILYYNLGVAYIHIKDYSNAEKAFIDCIGEDKTYSKAYMNIVYIKLLVGDIKGAYRVIKSAMTYCTDNEIIDAERKLLKII